MAETQTSALKYEGALRATVTSRHRDAVLNPVPLPGPSGAFTQSRLPWVFPLVLDTHALGRDLGRRARCGRTILVSGACSGVLRLFVSRHVVDEVSEYMERWAELGQRPLDEVEALWAHEYLPLLRVVDVPAGPLYADERARVDVLATRTHPLGDPDDVPTAILGLLLDAPVLSQDEKLLRAVYGHDFNCKAHGEWLEALRAGGDLGPLGDFLNAAYFLTAGVGMGAYALVAKSVELFGWPLTLIVFGAGAVGFHLLASDEIKTKVWSGLKKGASDGLEFLQALLVTAGHARAEIDALRPGSAPMRFGTNDPDALLRRVCLHAVARARSGHVSAEQLSEMLYFLEVPHGEKKVRELLRSDPTFAEVYQGRFQLGRALVRQAAPEPSLPNASIQLEAKE